MSDKEKLENKETLENTEVTPIEDDVLDKVTGGGSGLNPPRVDIHPYDDDVKSRM